MVSAVTLSGFMVCFQIIAHKKVEAQIQEQLVSCHPHKERETRVSWFCI